MTTIGYKRCCIILAIACAVEAICLWSLAWKETHSSWDAQTARIAMRRMENNRKTALQGSIEDAITALQDASSCYIPWKWQRPDLSFGELVEERRAVVIKDIINSLRSRTGTDHGDKPEKWIEAAGKLPKD